MKTKEPKAVDFELEKSPKVRGEVPEAVVRELVRMKEDAKAIAKDYRDGIEAQAKAYGVKKGALNRLITAKAADKVMELNAETASLSLLLERVL